MPKFSTVSSPKMPKFSLVLNKFAEILNSQIFKSAEILSTFYLIVPSSDLSSNRRNSALCASTFFLNKSKAPGSG